MSRLSLVICTLFVALPALAQEYEVIRNVRLKADPGPAGQPLRTLHRAEELFADDEHEPDGDYIAVFTLDDERGWVYAPYVRSIGGDDVLPRGTSAIPTPTNTPAADGTLSLHFIEIGQGDATLVICPNGTRILVDAGTTSDFEAEDVRDYLVEETDADAPWVNALVITHPDKDHYSLLEQVLAGFAVGHVYHVGNYAEYTVNNFDDWLRRFPPARRTKFSSSYHDEPDAPNPDIDCGEAEVFVLAANVGSEKNARSIVMMLRFGQFEAILTGDATTQTEAEIDRRYPASFLDADVLKLGHHGSSNTSTGTGWANTVTPEVAVASAAINNRHGHPNQAVYDVVAPHTIAWPSHAMVTSEGTWPDRTWNSRAVTEAIFSTAATGTVVIRTEGDGDYEIESFFYGS